MEADSTRPFDVVTSWQSGEHVDEIQAFADLTANLLAPAGVAIHRINFGPHDCWCAAYDDPTLSLRFPATVWRLMGSNRGYPNRGANADWLAAWDCQPAVEVMDPLGVP